MAVLWSNDGPPIGKNEMVDFSWRNAKGERYLLDQLSADMTLEILLLSRGRMVFEGTVAQLIEVLSAPKR